MAFLDLLLAAMKDAALEGELTQLQITITPEGATKSKTVRIIIIPEELKWTWPKDQPAGTNTQAN